MAQIALTRGLFATVDDDDFEKLSKFKWMANFSRRKFYATRGDNKIMMHHAVINYVKQPGFEIDHINGDSLDNRKENIRIVTHKENSKNINYPKTRRPMFITHCSRGHKFTEESTYTCKKTGKRQCRICNKIRKASYV